MSILTSLLLLVAGITLLIVLLRARPKVRIRRLEEWESDRLEIGAQICHAAARDAFDMILDGSLSSIEVIDHLVEQGWPSGRPQPAQEHDAVIGEDADHEITPATDIDEDFKSDEQFAIGCYLGTVIAKYLDGQWRVDAEMHRWPHVFFSRADLAVSPFELVERKFAAPREFQVSDAIERLSSDIERRTNIRATTWHNAGEERVSFGEPTEHSE